MKFVTWSLDPLIPAVSPPPLRPPALLGGHGTGEVALSFLCIASLKGTQKTLWNSKQTTPDQSLNLEKSNTIEFYFAHDELNKQALFLKLQTRAVGLSLPHLRGRGVAMVRCEVSDPSLGL